MAIKKAKFKPPVYDAQGAVSYPNTVHLETSADMVKYNDSNIESELSNIATQTDEHLESVMPHQITNLKTGKKYRYGYQISVDGIPQIISEEVI